MDYFLVEPDLLFLLFGVCIAVLVLVEVKLLKCPSSAIGINRRYLLTLLALCLLGSYVNIPVTQLPSWEYTVKRKFFIFGMKYVIPVVVEAPGTVIAINIGGALIPTGLSMYLLIKRKLYLLSMVGIPVVACIVYLLASPIPGTGIAVPVFIPPLVTVAVALLLSRTYAAPLAYVCGTLGTLIGGDLLNLDHVSTLGTPAASIGGAGLLDGIFITGFVAMVFAIFVTKGQSLPFQ